MEEQIVCNLLKESIALLNQLTNMGAVLIMKAEVKKMELSVFQKGFNYSQDGPGNRLVYHLAGCSLQCPWCSNPEGKAKSAGKRYSTQQLVAEAVSAKPMFFGGGGVTLTGGEVTEQFEVVRELLEALRKENIHTCIETNGMHPRLPELAQLVDYLIMDVKHPNMAAHQAVIGVSNRPVLANLEALKDRQVAVRIPLIGGFNDDAADDFALLLKERNITVEVLRYHEYGKDKYKALGLEYPMTQRAYISDETYIQFVQTLKKAGINVIRT